MSAKILNKQAAKFVACLLESLPEMTDPVMKHWIDKPAELQKFLSGLSRSDISVVNMDKIYVDYSIRPNYPEWMKEVLRPYLEFSEPKSFDAGELAETIHWQWSHSLANEAVYDEIVSKDRFDDCLGLRDLEEIRKKGIAFFRKHFKGKTVFAWKSVVQAYDGHIGVPCLVEQNAMVCIIWVTLDPKLLTADTGLRLVG